MIFLYSFIIALIMLIISYVHIKTYQLVGYNASKFLDRSIKFNLAIGDKNSLKFTKRLIRFIFMYFVLVYGLNLLVFAFIQHWALILLDIIVLILFLPLIMMLAHIILCPLEHWIKKYYMNKAKKKLLSKKCIKIGITGSYGKTSTKNILYEMLSKQFKVCVTPSNFNTEMGITRTILENLDDHDIFIAEMGARNEGDIEVLTRLVEPDYAITTTIGPAHIETFKSLDVIERTKFELLRCMSPNGSAVINGDSNSGQRLYKKCTRTKFLTCKPNSFAYAKDIKLGKVCTFTLVIDGKELEMKTKLLGKFNIDNITTAAALAYILGLSFKDIKDAVWALSPTPHRLELITSGKLSILDDSYNSNIIGASEALKTMSLFEGRKIVITPGFVELGDQQASANFKLGAEVADIADYVIIMNEINKNQILAGLISHNFPKSKIFFANTRMQQKQQLEKLTCENCIILFENDLPDDYK